MIACRAKIKSKIASFNLEKETKDKVSEMHFYIFMYNK